MFSRISSNVAPNFAAAIFYLSEMSSGYHRLSILRQSSLSRLPESQNQAMAGKADGTSTSRPSFYDHLYGARAIAPFYSQSPKDFLCRSVCSISTALKKLNADGKFVGSDCPGSFGVLHTRGRQLGYHPHIHYIVPGGALNLESGFWHSSRIDFFPAGQSTCRDLSRQIPGWNEKWRAF